MFSKGVVLIFLILGLSSSIAHAIPNQNRAYDPCDVRLFHLDRGRFRISHHIQDNPQKSAAVLVSSPSNSKVSKNTTTDKGADKSSSDKGISTSCLIHDTVLIAHQKAATIPNQGTPPSQTEEREAIPHSPETRVQILRAKTVPHPMTMAIRM